MARGLRRTDTDPGWINRRFAEQDRKIKEAAAAKRLAHSSLSEDFTLTPGGAEPSVPMPVPAGITVEAGTEVALVTWSGSASFTIPATFGRLAIHASKISGYTPTAGTEVASITSPFGGITSFAADGGDTYYLRFVFVSLRGEVGDYTGEFSVTPRVAADPDTFAGSIVGGSIHIAQGVSDFVTESFAGTTLPAGWTSTRVGLNGAGTAGANLPGASVVATGPTGQDGSALLVDLGAAGGTDSTYAGSGEVATDLADAANAEIEVRFRQSVGFTNDIEDVRLAIRSQDGPAWSASWDAVTVEFGKSAFGGGAGFAVSTVANGATTSLGEVAISTDPTADWHRMKFRVLSGQVAVKVWRDGDAEPDWSTWQATGVNTPGKASLVWTQYPNAFFSTQGYKLWVDEFNVNNFAQGFSVAPDGVARVATAEFDDLAVGGQDVGAALATLDADVAALTPVVGSRLRSTDQTITTGTTTKVALDTAYGPTTSTSTYTMLAFASSQFTVPTTGWYNVVGTVSWSPDATLTGARYTYIRVNSTDALWKAEVPTPGTFPQTVAGLVFANAGDTISLWCRHTKGSNHNVIGAADKLTYLDVAKA